MLKTPDINGAHMHRQMSRHIIRVDSLTLKKQTNRQNQ